MKKMVRVFLGGTCNGSTWRQKLIPMIEGKVSYFDPVVPVWDDEAYKRELVERENADYVVYTITPAMVGVYSIAEVVDDSNKRPQKTVLCILGEEDGKGWDMPIRNSLTAVYKMVKANGAHVVEGLEGLAQFLLKAKATEDFQDVE